MSTTAQHPPSSPVAAPTEPPPPAAAATGDPAVLGLPSFVAGSVALGLALVGYVSAAAGGATLPIILMATGLGLIVSAVWAAALGQTLVACIFGLFAGFWWSYAVLVLGLNHKRRPRGADARERLTGPRDHLVPDDPQDALAVGLEQRLALGVVFASELVVVPGGAVGLDDQALLGPAEVRDGPAAFDVVGPGGRDRPAG